MYLADYAAATEWGTTKAGASPTGRRRCRAWLVVLVLVMMPVSVIAETPAAPGDDVPTAEPPAAGVEDAPEVDKQIDDHDPADLQGRRIADVQFHCDLELCQDEAVRQRFKDIAGISPGEIYHERHLERAQQRLAKTGFFQELTIERSLESDGVTIAIDAAGAVLIRRVNFEGLRPPPFEHELRNMLMYRPGQVYVEDREQAAAQLSSLKSMFEQEGYFGTRIQMRAEQVDDHPHLVDLVFEVDPGQRRRVCAMGFRGLRAMTTAQARELMLTGTSVIARRIPLMLPRFTGEQFRDGRDALIEEYRRRGYFRARIVDQAVQVDEETNCVQLVVDISEGPYWAIEFDGNEAVDSQRLREEMPFADSGFVDDNEIREARHAIRQIYEAQGYPFTQVQGREEADDQFDRRLLFTIEEGPRVQIDEVRFEGMEHFEPEEILDEFGTRPFGLFDTGGFLLTEQLLADFDRLEQRYREEGYLQAVVDRFVVQLNERGDGITIWIYVNEQQQAQVDEVTISGNEKLDTDQLLRQLEVESGSSFVPLVIQADQSRLSQHYGSRGYPEARVATRCRGADGEPVECSAPRLPEDCKRTTFEQLTDDGCHWTDDDRPTLACDRTIRTEECRFEEGITDHRVSVDHQIQEGPKAVVGEILLKGNFRTRSGVIFRELPLETGDVMDVQKLLEGQGNMRSLGLFDSVSIETIGLDEQDGELDNPDNPADSHPVEDRKVPLIVSVEESRSRFIDMRFGVEGRELFDDSRRLLATGELQYIDDNLFGTGQRFRPRIIGATDTLDLARLGADTTDDVEAAGGITGLDYLVGAELIYNHPRFLRGQTGIDELFLTVTPFYLQDLLGVTTEGVLREEWGLRLELRKELVELMERFYVSMGVEAKQAATWTPGDQRMDGERVFSPRRATGKLMPELTLDRRDSPLNPSEGFHLGFQPELVSGDALAQDGEEMIGDSYWRLSFAASHFITPVEGLTLGQGLEFGQVIPLFDRQTRVPMDERYFMGGVGTVRGFPGNSLGPLDREQRPLGGEFLLNYNAELRYPLLGDWGLYGATFFDAGVLVDCFDEQGQRSSSQCYRNAFPASEPGAEVRTAAGLGLRYLLMDQIPVLLDYGMVLNRRPSEGFGSLHFNLGYTF